MKPFAIGLGLLILAIAYPLPVWCSDYPWEQEAKQQEKVWKQEKKEGPSYGRFGPFLVEELENWGYQIDADMGPMLGLLNSWGMMETAIVLADVLETDDPKGYESRIAKKLTHDYRGKLSFAGKKNVLVLRDKSDGSTMFHLFPYNNGKSYWLYVLYNEERKTFTPAVKAMLKTFRFVD
jgi:hypothetical protein